MLKTLTQIVLKLFFQPGIVLRYGLFLCVLGLATSNFAQQWNKTTHDFGKQKNWSNPTAFFLVSNNTGKTIFLLPTHYDPQIQILFEKKEIKPGEVLEIQVKYFSPFVGRFDVNVPIYLSNLNKPFLLQLKGQIISFDRSALQECPRIENNSQSLSNLQVNHHFEVVNEENGLPIEGVRIQIQSRYSSEKFISKKSQFATQRKQPELVLITIEKDGFEQYEQEIYLGKSQNSTLIKLRPIPGYNPVVKSQPNEDNMENNEETKVEKSTSWTDKMLEKWSDLSTPKEDIKELSKTDLEDEVIEDYESEDFDWSSLKRKNHDKEVVKIETETDKKEEPIETPILVDHKNKDTSLLNEFGQLNPNLFVTNHLIFIIDISKSMDHPQKLPLLKSSIVNLIQLLRPEDKLTIITYNTESVVLMDAVSGMRKNEMINVVEGLKAGGQSYGDDAVKLAFELALKNFIPEGNNEIILATDGIFNTPKYNQKSMERMISKQFKSQNILFSTIGFGRNNYAHDFLQSLSSKGSGSYTRVNSQEEIDEGVINGVLSHSRRRNL
jgi:hypothetical protein